MEGKVYLVGAGPGDPELLTRRAWSLLQSADVVLHDDLVSDEVLAAAPAQAQVLSVGKRAGRKTVTQVEISALLVAGARAGLTVVRLKSGDPQIFGRLGEEMDALREAGIDFEVVPGVTAAFAAAASARIQLTGRRVASQLVFIPGRVAEGKSADEAWGRLPSNGTVVIYMPGSDYQGLAERLHGAGISTDTPCLIVSCASRHDEKRHLTTVGRLPEVSLVTSPSLLIVGAAAATGGDSVQASEPLVTAVPASAAR